MAGLVPAIDVFEHHENKAWMPGTRVYTWAGRRPDPGAGHDGFATFVPPCAASDYAAHLLAHAIAGIAHALVVDDGDNGMVDGIVRAPASVLRP